MITLEKALELEEIRLNTLRMFLEESTYKANPFVYCPCSLNQLQSMIELSEFTITLFKREIEKNGK